MRKLLFVLVLVSCAMVHSAQLPADHPMLRFWQIASKGHTTEKVCNEFGGVVVPEFVVVQSLRQGVQVIKSKVNGLSYTSVSFGDKNFMGLVTVRQCGFR